MCEGRGRRRAFLFWKHRNLESVFSLCNSLSSLRRQGETPKKIFMSSGFDQFIGASEKLCLSYQSVFFSSLYTLCYFGTLCIQASSFHQRKSHIPPKFSMRLRSKRICSEVVESFGAFHIKPFLLILIRSWFFGFFSIELFHNFSTIWRNFRQSLQFFYI